MSNTTGAWWWKQELLETLLDQNFKKYSMLLELDFEKIASAKQRLFSMFEIYFGLLKNDESFRQVERIHFFEKFAWEEKELLKKYSQNDIAGFEKYASEIYKQWILRLEFKNSFLPEIFSASFVSFFTGIIMQFLPLENFDESLNQAKQRLEVFLKGVE